MSVRNLSFSQNEFYHIYNRGVDKRGIFLDDQDRNRFIRLMFICNGAFPVVYRNTQKLSLSEIRVGNKLSAVGAYCLMHNHFHILVKETEEGGTVKFMSKLLTAYSSYFNRKYERTGTLFGAKFKSSHLDSDEYLKYMFAYIHLNPLKILDPNWKEKTLDLKTAKNFLDKYFCSSHADYAIGTREESVILNKEVFPEYFKNAKDFESYLYDWLNFEITKGLPWEKLGITICLILSWILQSNDVLSWQDLF